MMKKWMALMVCVLALMVCVGAGASSLNGGLNPDETSTSTFVLIDPLDTTGALQVGSRAFMPVPVEQYHLIIPDGVVFTSKSQDPGDAQFAVNDKTTDWFKAIAHTGTGWGDVQMLYQVKVPKYKVWNDDHTSYSEVAPSFVFRTFGLAEDISGPFDSGNLLPVEIDPNWGNAVFPNSNGMPYTENSLRFATTLPELGMLAPKNAQDTMWIGWYDENRNPLGYQVMTVSVSHPNETAFEASIHNPVPASRIKLDSNYQDKATVSDGSVNYVASNCDLYTGIQAPEGATQYQLYSNLKSGGATSPTDIPSDGYVKISLKADKDKPVHSLFKCITFHMANESPKNETIVIGYQSSDELLPWPAYQQGFAPSLGDLIIENGAEDAGYELDLNDMNGKITARFSGSTNGGKPGVVRYKLWRPSSEITHYRVIKTGGNNILGQGAKSPESLYAQFDSEYRNGPLPITEEKFVIEVDEPFKAIRTGDTNVVIYTPDFSANVQGHADLYAVQWFNADGEMKDDTTYYFWQQLEDFTLVHKDEPVLQLKDITSEITKPTIVVPNGRPFENLFLRSTAYITDRSDAWAYDFSLVDANGNAVKPNAPVWIYLPYPDGHTPGQKYKINHYMNGSFESGILGTSEVLNVEDVLYGLRFETDSFSPFILSTDDGTAAAGGSPVTPPPATGDATPVAFLAALALLSAAGVLLLRRRVKAN